MGHEPDLQTNPEVSCHKTTPVRRLKSNVHVKTYTLIVHYTWCAANNNNTMSLSSESSVSSDPQPFYLQGTFGGFELLNDYNGVLVKGMSLSHPSGLLVRLVGGVRRV